MHHIAYLELQRAAAALTSINAILPVKYVTLSH